MPNNPADNLEVTTSNPETQAGAQQNGQPGTQTQTQGQQTQEQNKGSYESGKQPFNENPAFRERINEIEAKYGEKATLYDSISEIAAEDPKLSLSIIQGLERKGKAPAGSYERAKAELEPLIEQQEKREKSSQQQPEPVEKKQEVELEKDPVYSWAKEQKRADDEKREQEKQALLEFLTRFEEERPDIAKTKNPGITRKLISLNAQEIMENENVDYATAMDKAYKRVLHKEEEIENARESGLIDGQLRNAQLESATTVTGQTPASRARKLTKEEEQARQHLGIETQRYVELLDNPNSGVVDDA